MIRKQIKWIGILLFGIALGAFLGVLLCNWHYFEFEKTIKYSDLLSLVVTTFVGLFIASVISHQETSSRGEREFFISDIKSLMAEVNRLKSFASANTFPFNETKKLFKEINEHLHSLEFLLNESSTCQSVKLEEKILKNILEIREIVTKPSPVNNSISLPPEEQIKVEGMIKDIKMSLGKLILEINK